ncbi:MAG: hypothetical protein V1800_18155, partial [Candidatus Latescibacterota bacterium]
MHPSRTIPTPHPTHRSLEVTLEVTRFLLAVFTCMTLPVQSHAAEPDPLALILKQGYAPGQLIIKLDESRMGKAALQTAGLERLHERFGVTDRHELFPENNALAKVGKMPSEHPLRGIYQLRFDPDVDVEQAAAAYQADPSVLYAQPNYLMRDFGTKSHR